MVVGEDRRLAREDDMHGTLDVVAPDPTGHRCLPNPEARSYEVGAYHAASLPLSLPEWSVYVNCIQVMSAQEGRNGPVVA